MQVYKALLNIEKNCPELFLLMKHVKIEAENIPSAYAKAQVKEKTFKIAINKEWIENFNVHNLSAIIEHELLHIVLSHCVNIKTISNPTVLNIAADCIINDLGHFFQDKKLLNDDLKNGVFLDTLNKQYKTEFCSQNNTSREIYDFLMSQKNQEKCQSFDEGLKKPENNEGDDQGQDNAGQDETLTLDDILSPDEKKAVLKKYSHGCKDVKEFLFEIEKLEKNKMIKREIERFFTSNKKDRIRTLKKPNRRYSHLPYGTKKDKTQKVLLALDVSGSMFNPEDFAKLKMTVHSAASNGFEVDLIFGDTKKVGEYKNIKASFEFEKNIHGGGGTELSFIFEEKLNDYDCIVIGTDTEFCHSELPQNRKNQILILSTSEKIIDGFKTINI